MRLQRTLGSDIAEIKPVIPYTGSDDAIVKQCEDEVKREYRPEIQTLPYDVKEYEVVAIGTPTWWYTVATPVQAFISANQWAGKTVIPFQTSCGWPGHGLEDLKAACKGAVFQHEMHIQFNPKQFGLLVTPEKEVEHWVDAVSQARA
ncbi:hypothetical protein SPSIL_040270 [Sporomusa silvacetica DSM 10669]|uniref:Flavodoxin-like domain-containing protein n=1 Tax=Sporomusa silvacetica DSM 10669 TaxID=1123289 RepID=A0ABZ3IQS2_9FIRM|nr:flavodoxin [Sporomusa silvacetica]OZC17214.1 flavodoxin [Sporomusa silvacetica DSM 10669]